VTGTEPGGFAPDWPAVPRVRAWTSTRAGGVSRGAYASLNLAAHVGDRDEDVRENRRRVRAALRLPGEPCWLEQVHGAAVRDLDEPRSVPPADGAVSSRSGVVCAVLTADCLPVLLTDAGGRRVAAAHAGWRGLAAGILPAAVAAMRGPPAELLAWIGPGIGAGAYEVGDEVRTAFVTASPSAAGAFTRNASGRWQADLEWLARASLEAAGVTRIYGGGFCTYSDSGRFFSHRREAPCGRMASLIWLEDA
jgi:YfiH family protein